MEIRLVKPTGNETEIVQKLYLPTPCPKHTYWEVPIAGYCCKLLHLRVSAHVQNVDSEDSKFARRDETIQAAQLLVFVVLDVNLAER